MLGITHGYYNVKNPVECYYTDFVIEQVSDLKQNLAKADTNQSAVLNTFYRCMENQLEKLNSDYIASGKLTIGDFAMADFYFSELHHDEY